MDDSEIQKQLTWEVERKIISDASSYNFDFSIIGDTGFVFAGRKKLISDISSLAGEVMADVEPVALFNGCEGAGEISDGTVMLISIEAEGISSVVVTGEMPVSMESFPIIEDEISSVLEGLDIEGISNIDSSIIERLTGYVFESIERLTSFGENKGNPTPEQFILAGSGVYSVDISDMIEKKYEITARNSDPFASLSNDIKDINPDLSGLSAAFTTCFGLALRAMEV